MKRATTSTADPFRDGGQEYPLSSSPHQSPSQNETIVMKFVPKIEMNILVVKMVVKSKTHLVLGTMLCVLSLERSWENQLNQ